MSDKPVVVSKAMAGMDYALGEAERVLDRTTRTAKWESDRDLRQHYGRA